MLKPKHNSVNWNEGMVAAFAAAMCFLPTFLAEASSPKASSPKASSPKARAKTTTSAAVVPDAAGQRVFLERSRAEHNARVVWKPLTSMTFDSPAALQKFRVIEGRWVIVNGKLQAISGKPDDNRTILLMPSPTGSLRIEFDATLFPRADGRVGDICLRLNADPDTGSFERGHALITAQYWNQATVCYKLNIPIARTEWSPIVPRRRHRIVLEWTPAHLRFFVDGRVVIDAWDRDTPLSPDPTKWIGLSSYDTHMAIDNFTISTSAGA